MTLRQDPDHDAVCQAEGGHHLVVAPPGTGKTCLSVRLAGTIAQTLRPYERVLLLTFSNQARTQLQHEAARQLPPEIRRQVEVANYHRFFRREVWAHRRALGLPLDVQIGTFRRRREALRVADAEAVEALRQHEGMLEAFAEQRFARFRDERAPNEDRRERLLAAVEHELRFGRLVFDDLGALFWALLERYPVLDGAYQARYPVVIADEHQDASELQDAVVRRLADRRLVVLADPMQLIYGFRGSKPERLQRHIDEADDQFVLRTPHRWHGDEQTGRWLLAVRARLLGEADASPTPASVETSYCRYFNQMKARVKAQAARAFHDGMNTVAVISAFNTEVRQLRTYLCREGMYPRQIGGGDDFEEAHEDIEQLPLLADPENVARHAVDRVAKLVPTLSNSTVETVKHRIAPTGVNLAGRLGVDARALLTALAPLYVHGSSAYFATVADCLDACAARHHLPRVEAVRALQVAADTFSEGEADLDSVLARYAESVAAAAQSAPRLGRGLYVMTAHQAKGKEFDVVIVVNAGDRQFPDTDEGRRLFYVTITRASKRWIILAPEDGASPLLRHLTP